MKFAQDDAGVVRLVPDHNPGRLLHDIQAIVEASAASIARLREGQAPSTVIGSVSWYKDNGVDVEDDDNEDDDEDGSSQKVVVPLRRQLRRVTARVDAVQADGNEHDEMLQNTLYTARTSVNVATCRSLHISIRG